MGFGKKSREFIGFVNDNNSFLITTHINPDGDGIGSMLALRAALEAKGKSVVMYNKDPIPDSLLFLPGANEIVFTIPRNINLDAVIMVDCAEPIRAGQEFADFSHGMKIAIIDHHLYHESSDALMCLDSNAASAGNVVWKLIDLMGVKKTREMALCIYTTLVVDTGFFRYSNTTSDVLVLAAELVGFGADPWLVAKNIDESYSLQRFYLLGESLKTLNVSCEGRYASMDITRDLLKKTGADLMDSDEFATYPRSIKTVEVATLFREISDNRIKVSLRSKDYINVAEIAHRFGGGGHKHAAGFTIDGDIQTIKVIMMQEMEKAFSELDRQ